MIDCCGELLLRLIGPGCHDYRPLWYMIDRLLLIDRLCLIDRLLGLIDGLFCMVEIVKLTLIS